MIVAHKNKAGLWNYCVARGPFDEIVDESRQGYADKGKLIKGLIAGISERMTAAFGDTDYPLSIFEQTRLKNSITWMQHAEYLAWRRRVNAAKAKARKARKARKA